MESERKRKRKRERGRERKRERKRKRKRERERERKREREMERGREGERETDLNSAVEMKGGDGDVKKPWTQLLSTTPGTRISRPTRCGAWAQGHGGTAQGRRGTGALTARRNATMPRDTEATGARRVEQSLPRTAPPPPPGLPITVPAHTGLALRNARARTWGPRVQTRRLCPLWPVPRTGAGTATRRHAYCRRWDLRGLILPLSCCSARPLSALGQCALPAAFQGVLVRLVRLVQHVQHVGSNPGAPLLFQTPCVKQEQGSNAGVAILQHLRQPAHCPKIMRFQLHCDFKKRRCAHALSLLGEHRRVQAQQGHAHSPQTLRRRGSLQGLLAELAGLGNSPSDETFKPRAQLESARVVGFPRQHPRQHQLGPLIVAPFAQQHQCIAAHRMNVARVALQDMLETRCSTVGIAAHQVQDVAQIQGGSQVQLVDVQAAPQLAFHLIRISCRKVSASALPARLKATLGLTTAVPVPGACPPPGSAPHPQSVLPTGHGRMVPVAGHRGLHRGCDGRDEPDSCHFSEKAGTTALQPPALFSRWTEERRGERQTPPLCCAVLPVACCVRARIPSCCSQRAGRDSEQGTTQSCTRWPSAEVCARARRCRVPSPHTLPRPGRLFQRTCTSTLPDSVGGGCREVCLRASMSKHAPTCVGRGRRLRGEPRRAKTGRKGG